MTKRQRLLIEKDKIEQEFQVLVEQQEAERDEILAKITEIMEGKNLFLGVILTEEDILNILKLKFATKDNIRIPFQLYINEPEDDNGTI
jgi:hypothetical protein